MTRLRPNARDATLNPSETSQFSSSTISCEVTREQAEERRWQLEWDRRNTED
jgi:hypothetical protein